MGNATPGEPVTRTAALVVVSLLLPLAFAVGEAMGSTSHPCSGVSPLCGLRKAACICPTSGDCTWSCVAYAGGPACGGK